MRSSNGQVFLGFSQKVIGLVDREYLTMHHWAGGPHIQEKEKAHNEIRPESHPLKMVQGPH